MKRERTRRATGQFRHASEFSRLFDVSNGIEQVSEWGGDQERAGALAELQKLLSEGLESGVSGRTIDDVLNAAREQAKIARSS